MMRDEPPSQLAGGARYTLMLRTKGGWVPAPKEAGCQSASKIDPRSACEVDP